MHDYTYTIMHILLHTHTHIVIHIYTYVYTRIHIFLHAHTHILTRTYTFTACLVLVLFIYLSVFKWYSISDFAGFENRKKHHITRTWKLFLKLFYSLYFFYSVQIDLTTCRKSTSRQIVKKVIFKLHFSWNVPWKP